MPDPISLAAGYFLLKTALSLGMSVSEDTGANKIGFELMKAGTGNFYYDVLKFGGQSAWYGITGRIRSEYNSNKPLNHDLQKAIRKSQIEATLSACESCFEDLKLQDYTLLEKLRNKLSLSDEEKWLKNVIQSLTINLAEIKSEDYVPPTLTNDVDVLKIADNRNYPLSDKSVQSLVNSIKEQTILEIRLANPPNHAQNQIALSLKQKIYSGWEKEFQGEKISVDWYKLFCDRFNEEYKKNPRVTNALQKAFFQDLKSESILAKQFADVSGNHFEKLGGKMLSKLESIEGKQDRLYEFTVIFKDENDKKLTEAIALLKDSVVEIKTFTADKTKETQNIVRESKSEIIEEVKNQFTIQNRQSDIKHRELKEHFDKSLTSYAEENKIKLDEAVQRINKFRRNILAERNLTVIERLFNKHRFSLFDKIFSNLTPQEEFFVSLKERYTSRYFNKLDNRFEITLMASDDLESEIKHEYRGVYEGHGQLKEAFEYMQNAFREANRLLIVGEPGVGKTVLLLKFANHLSDETVEKLNSNPELRLDDVKDPIPVIFNLASCSEDYKSFKDWLIAMLKTGEGLSENFAAELLDKKKIFLLLDGLDELAKNETPEKAVEIRAKCFHSIIGFLKGGQKAVICCRINEYKQIRKDIGQEEKEQRRKIPEVFVKNLDTSQLEDALKRASNTEIDREAALNILKLLEYEKSGVFLKILSVPFYFTTALEVFDNSILRQRNIPTNEQALKDYLVGILIREKLETSPPKPKKFKYKSSFKWLKWLAKTLKKKDKVIFELADLQPNDLRWSWVFKVLYGSISFKSFLFLPFLLFFITFLMQYSLQSISQSLFNYFSLKPTIEIIGEIFIIITILIMIFIILLPFSLLFGFRTKEILTEDSNNFSLKPLLEWKTWKTILAPSFLYTLVFTVIISLVSLIPSEQNSLSLGIRMLSFVFICVFLERVSYCCRRIKRFVHLENDYQRLKSGILFNLIRWSILLFCIVISTNASVGFDREIFNMKPIKIYLPFIIVLIVVNTGLFKHFILRFCLILVGSVPIRYATFLNYSAKARIVEKDGGVWRFRHQELQDYFAKLP